MATRRKAADRSRDIPTWCVGGAIAERQALNANQLFTWRRLYGAGLLGPATKLLPVAIADERLVEAVKVMEASAAPPVGCIEIKLTKGSLSLTGSVDLAVLRTALECLL